MRKALLWASTNPFLAERLPRMGFVKQATSRFMPGESWEEVLTEADELATKGIGTLVTLLGENLNSIDQADVVLDEYLCVLQDASEAGLDLEISVKLTQLGLDFGPEVAQERLRRLAASTPFLVWIDMESSDYVDVTLEVFRNVMLTNTNLGLCLQSYLRRTENDLESLLPLDPSIRLVKGAYKEPKEVAYPHKREVDEHYFQLSRVLLEARLNGGMARPVIATHDTRMIESVNRMAAELGVGKDDYEFAMLYGIERREQYRLANSGHVVRVLISYGPSWFPWYMRRLAERPANVWFVAKQLFRS